MTIRWTDVDEIAIALAKAHADIDPASVRFTDLHNFVLALPGFDDDPKRGGERVLEAIQAAWIAEAS